jgi:hypothetical protein
MTDYLRANDKYFVATSTTASFSWRLTTMPYPEPAPENWQLATIPKKFRSDADRFDFMTKMMGDQLVVGRHSSLGGDDDWDRRVRRYFRNANQIAPEDAKLAKAAKQLRYVIDQGEWKELKDTIREIEELRWRAGIDTSSSPHSAQVRVGGIVMEASILARNPDEAAIQLRKVYGAENLLSQPK